MDRAKKNKEKNTKQEGFDELCALIQNKHNKAFNGLLNHFEAKYGNDKKKRAPKDQAVDNQKRKK